MRYCGIVLVTALLAALVAEGARAQRFETNFGSAMAQKIAQACIAYAQARKGAVNVWVYNERGEMLHFQRMDGAPLMGPSFSSGPQYGGDPFKDGPGPVVAIPDTSPVAGVPVVIGGMTVGSVQALGMGDEGDLACAKAAAEAAEADH